MPKRIFQVASQQGTYLARLFSRGFEFSASVPQKSSSSNGDETGGAPGATPADGSSDPEGKDNKVPLSEKLGLSVVKGKFAKPFQFLNLGILAYTGAGGALAQVQVRSLRKAYLGCSRSQAYVVRLIRRGWRERYKYRLGFVFFITDDIVLVYLSTAAFDTRYKVWCGSSPHPAVVLLVRRCFVLFCLESGAGWA